MFRFAELFDSKKPKRRFGLLAGGIIVIAGMSFYNPAKSLLSGDAGVEEKDGGESGAEMLPVEECQTTESLTAIATDLQRRKNLVEQKRLAVERESRALKRARTELELQLREIETQRDKLQDRIDEWNAKRTKERVERIAKLADIMGEMKPAEAAQVIEKTNPDLAVDVLLALEKKHAAKVLAKVDTDKAVALTKAMSDGSR